MVAIHRKDDKFVFEIKGLHKLWTLKSELTIPSENIIRSYIATPEDLKNINGLRMPGTHIPGLITAGTYISFDGNIFCDIAHKGEAIVVELKDEYYKKIIVEVEDANTALHTLNTR